jgi:hypothetical protein
VKLLSDEWLALVQEQAAALPEQPGLSLVMQHVVSGSPSGKVQCGVEVRDGRLVACAIGKRTDAGCTVTWTYADAMAALRGADLDVAFMRGDLKVDGDYRRFLLDLRQIFATAEGAAFLAAVRAATDDL